MRRLRRPLRPQRRRVFLGCEGESEQGYGALLRRLREQRGPDLHLEVVLLQPGGGDPLALVELAVQRIAENENKRQAPYVIRALLLDHDGLGRNLERDAKIPALAASATFRLIWQRPCHEGLLLRHLEGCSDMRPPTSEIALAELTRRWPTYVKGLPAMRLAERLGEPEIARARSVEPELDAFLQDIRY